MRDFPEVVWPLLGQAIVSDRKKAWRFELLLGDKFAFDDAQRPSLLFLPEDVLFAWCHAYPDTAPAFTAGIVPLLTNRNPNDAGRTLHPTAKRLLNQFGDRPDVLNAFTRNLHNFGWSGSLANYFALYDSPLSELHAHKLGAVRRWADKTRSHLRDAAAAAHNEDEERDALSGRA